MSRIEVAGYTFLRRPRRPPRAAEPMIILMMMSKIKVYVKAKFFLCMMKHQAMKSYGAVVA